MSTLLTPKLTTLLQRLYDAARGDDAALATAHREIAQRGTPNDRERAELYKEAYLPVAPELGRLLYLLTRNKAPRLAVEFGTSFGISALHIAAALRDTGTGRLITTELSESKARQAQRNLVEGGLDDLVEIRVGDAFETLRHRLEPGIDLLLLDGWKEPYLRLLQMLEPHLAPGALILADDTLLAPDALAPYLAHVRDPAKGYLSVALPIDDGMEISQRAG